MISSEAPPAAPSQARDSGALHAIIVIARAFEEDDQRRAEQEYGMVTAFPSRQVNAERYQALSQLQGTLYQQLSFKNAISTIRPEPFYFLTTGLFVLGMKVASFISSAYAEGFTLPLNMSQKDFSIVVFMLVGVFILLLLGLFWAGFIAKPKSAAAASAVQHMVTFLAGAILGIKV